jgi:3-hydroxyisobutyrate dehydrogenase
MPVTTASAPHGFGPIGFIGLGDMGGPMAHNLIAGGFDVTVFDLRREALLAAKEKGARIADSLAGLPQSCRTVGICVWSDDQVNDAVLGPQGLITGDAKAFTLVVHSTVRPQTIDRIAAAFAPKGWEVVDAPVSGGRAASLTGTLSLMVGAPKASYERLLPYLNTVGAHLFHVGEKPGLGEVAKLCNNLMGLCNTYAVVEAMKLGASYGIDEEMVRKVASVSTGMSWYTEHWEFVDNLIKTHPQRDVLYKDLWEAVYAAKQKDLQLVLTGVAALSAPGLIDERRALLNDRQQKGGAK